jgi:hypothetical protein
MGPEAEAFAEAEFGPGGPVSQPKHAWHIGVGDHKIVALEKALRRQAERWTEFAKRKTLKLEIPIAVAGDLPKAFGAIWRAARDAAKTPWKGEVAVFTVTQWQAKLEWDTGYYRLSSNLFPVGEDFAGYSGKVTIDPVLVRAGGPFQVNIGVDGLTLESVGKQIQTWRLALGFVREFCKSPIRRRSLTYRDIIFRFRHGAKVSFASTRGRYNSNAQTIVSLSSGAAATEIVAIAKARAEDFGRKADRVASYLESLENRALAAAERFTASESNQAENITRELRRAEESFIGARADLFQVAQTACYKDEIPASAEEISETSLPTVKNSVSDGLAHRYSMATRTLHAAGERLAAALAAARPLPQATPASESALEAPAKSQVLVTSCGQVVMAF